MPLLCGLLTGVVRTRNPSARKRGLLRAQAGGPPEAYTTLQRCNSACAGAFADQFALEFRDELRPLRDPEADDGRRQPGLSLRRFSVPLLPKPHIGLSDFELCNFS
jgi:hypothetical protein